MFESQVDPKIGFKMLMIHPDVREIPLARVHLNHPSLGNNDPAARGRFGGGGGWGES